MGQTIIALEEANWQTLSDMVRDRFGMTSLGGGVRHAHSQFEVKTFRFQRPNKHLLWEDGLPGKARIDRASEGNLFVEGRGANIDEAAMRAMITLWELTWLRAAQSDVGEGER